MLAAGPAAMLAMGMAGEPETEVYTRAGVLFWLFHYAAMHLAVLVGPRHQTPQTAWSWGSTPAVVSLLSLVALTLGVVGLIWLDREATHLVVCERPEPRLARLAALRVAVAYCNRHVQ